MNLNRVITNNNNPLENSFTNQKLVNSSKHLTNSPITRKVDDSQLNKSNFSPNNRICAFKIDKPNRFTIKGTTTNLHTFNNLNESFNESNYKKKKNENNNLKDQIEKLKDEVFTLVKANASLEEQKKSYDNIKKMAFTIDNFPAFEIVGSNVLVNSELNKFEEHKDNNINFNSPNILIEKLTEFKNSFKYSHFKDLKSFYINYQVKIEKIASKIDEINNRFFAVEKSLSNESQEKKVKLSQVKEIVLQIQKLISLINTTFSEYNKDVYYHNSNLKKVFDFVNKLIYSDNMYISSNSNSLILSNLKNSGYRMNNHNIFESK